MPKIIILTFLWLYLFLSTSIFPQSQASLTQDEFDQKMFQTYQVNNQTLVREMISSNRLKVKPFIDKTISQSIRMELNGQQNRADSIKSFCLSLATLFQQIHGERSLEIAMEYLDNWDLAKKRQKLIADSLYALGTKLRKQEDTRDQAMSTYEQALKIYREIDDKRGEGSTLGGIGFLYYYKKDFEQMHEYVQNALDLRIACDDKQLIGNSYNDLGTIIYWKFYGDLDNALLNLNKSVEIRLQIGDSVNAGNTLMRIGRIQEEKGDLQLALNAYLSAVETFKLADDKKQQISALIDCGYIKKIQGQFQESLKYLDQSLDIAEALGDTSTIANVLNDRGHLYRRLGEYELAYANYTKMLELMKAEGDEEGIADAHNNMGLLMGSMGRHKQALDNYHQSLSIYQKLDESDGILIALGNIGIEYAEMHQFKQAEKYYLQALSLSRKHKNTAAEINTLLNLGNALNNRDNLHKALDYYHQGLNLARKQNDQDQIWTALLGMGDNYERQQKYETALDHYNQALEILESMRGSLKISQYKASFFAGKRYIYDAIVHLSCMLHIKYPDKKYDERAFHYAEQAKARAFLDLMTESLQSVRSDVDQTLLNQQEQILVDLAQLDQNLQKALSEEGISEDSITLIKDQINRLEQAYHHVKEKLREKNPRYANLTYPQPLTLEEVQSLIPNDHTLILNYFAGDSSSALWAIKKETYQLIILPKENVLKEKIELLRFALSEPAANNTSPFTMCSYNLYIDLISPVRDLIKKDDELIIIADGILHYLPFEVLYSKPVDPEDLAFWEDMPYLVLDNPISYASSASIWAGLIAERKNRSGQFTNSLLAFGDPAFNPREKSPTDRRSDSGQVKSKALVQMPERLEYSGQEVAYIASLFNDEDQVVLFRQAASEENVKANASKSFRYIHFATHGLINERQPDFSALVFSRQNNSGEDGILHAAEIFSLKLETDLVVLSACQTGLGKMIRGEGMIGLSRAFMYAGSPSVLASLWRVSDESTAILMKEFYINLVKEKMHKSEALRRAQMEMIEDEDFAHPFYWAPFVLIGDYQ